jgi:hypothetical protein
MPIKSQVNPIMNKKNIICLFVLLCFSISAYSITTANEILPPENSEMQDPVKELQNLYNGRVWRNLYTNVRGDQFLFSKSYLPGSLTMNGKHYEDVNLTYDIYNDELLIPKNNGAILQLNKEMVDSFSFEVNSRKYYFRNTDPDSLDGIKGFVNVLYKGNSSLYVKYRKSIDLLAVDDKYDLFFQTQKIYLVKKGVVYQIGSKHDLLKALQEDKTQIKAFLKKNGLNISKKLPESFVPVVRFYDSLSQ